MAEYQSWRRLEVPEPLLAYFEDVQARLKYLHPEWKIVLVDQTLLLDPSDAGHLVQIEEELFYLLCRAKLYRETHPQREALFRLAFGS